MEENSQETFSQAPVTLQHSDLPSLDCPICFEQFTMPLRTQCGHMFCKVCLYSAFEKKPECPLCREPLLTRLFRKDELMECIIRSKEEEISKLKKEAQKKAMRKARIEQNCKRRKTFDIGCYNRTAGENPIRIPQIQFQFPQIQFQLPQFETPPLFTIGSTTTTQTSKHPRHKEFHTAKKGELLSSEERKQVAEIQRSNRIDFFRNEEEEAMHGEEEQAQAPHSFQNLLGFHLHEEREQNSPGGGGGRLTPRFKVDNHDPTIYNKPQEPQQHLQQPQQQQQHFPQHFTQHFPQHFPLHFPQHFQQYGAQQNRAFIPSSPLALTPQPENLYLQRQITPLRNKHRKTESDIDPLTSKLKRYYNSSRLS